MPDLRVRHLRTCGTRSSGPSTLLCGTGKGASFFQELPHLVLHLSRLYSKPPVRLVVRATVSARVFFNPYLFPFPLFVLSLRRFATANRITRRWLWVFPLLLEELHSEEFLSASTFQEFGLHRELGSFHPTSKGSAFFSSWELAFLASNKPYVWLFSLYPGRPLVFFALLNTEQCVHRTPSVNRSVCFPLSLPFLFLSVLCASGTICIQW